MEAVTVTLIGSDGQSLTWTPQPDHGEYRAKRRLEHAAQRLGIPGPYTWDIHQPT